MKDNCLLSGIMLNLLTKPGELCNRHTVHIAGRSLVVRQLQILVSQFRVLRTGTLFEIRPNNMYQPLATILKIRNISIYEKDTFVNTILNSN
ncbi:hypothetical protein, partial [Maribellus luteus]|uniref:hypothetical protein n=1 Tax=Maribellus luteus TaxID=2305463 RepID=UPI0019D4AE32